MFGLAVLVIGMIYLVVLITVTRIAFVGARRRGYSTVRCWVAAAVGFLIVYLPVLWDFIPTHVANQYYCSTQAGFTVYKTVEQWVAENPNAAKGLTERENSPLLKLPDGTSQIVLNERFVRNIHRRHPIPFLPTQIFENVIMDTKNHEVIARNVNVASGPGGRDWRELKFWLNGSCGPTDEQFGHFNNKIQRLGQKN